MTGLSLITKGALFKGLEKVTKGFLNKSTVLVITFVKKIQLFGIQTFNLQFSNNNFKNLEIKNKTNNINLDFINTQNIYLHKK
ncbi:MAG: hypothetical protein ACTSWG_10465 [Candidatus Helarchaeota archaeon]